MFHPVLVKLIREWLLMQKSAPRSVWLAWLASFASLRTAPHAEQNARLLQPWRVDIVIVRSMGGRHIRVADRPIGTAIHAFLAALARLRMIDARMAMIEKDYLPKNTVWTRLHTFPAGLTFAAVEFNVLRVRVAPECERACPWLSWFLSVVDMTVCHRRNSTSERSVRSRLALEQARQLAPYPGEMKVQMHTKRKAHCNPRNAMQPMVHKLEMGRIPRSSVLHDCGENNHPQERKKEQVDQQMRPRLHALNRSSGLLFDRAAGFQESDTKELFHCTVQLCIG